MSSASSPANAKSEDDQLPDYAPQLQRFHRAFAAELEAAVNSLPLNPEMRVLDVGCGDGFYMEVFAKRLRSPGGVVGLDINPAFLKLARGISARQSLSCEVDFVLGELADLSGQIAPCDVVWCAQSLYSLPEPVEALRQMAELVRPGGIVAVLENDTMHQLLLPWPSHLEIALRTAELTSFCRQESRPSKYYVGRRLPAVFAEAGLEPLGFQSQCIDRRAPLDHDLEAFLQLYLQDLAGRAASHLDAASLKEFDALIDPEGDGYLLREPYFTMSWLNVLVWGRRPVA
jgi:SAM-dependent methyltransferase